MIRHLSGNDHQNDYLDDENTHIKNKINKNI